MEHTIKSLAIERESGSGGREIGIRVAEKLGIPYYDSTLLAEAADKYNVSIKKLLDYEEKGNGTIIDNLVIMANYMHVTDVSEIYGILNEVAETIKKLKEKGPAVFIGRCATEVLKYRPEIVRIFIYSSSEQKKIRRMMMAEPVSEEQARKMMAKKDANRRNYFHFFSEKEWKDRNNYDMELNTDMIPIEECVDLLAYRMTK